MSIITLLYLSDVFSTARGFLFILACVSGVALAVIGFVIVTDGFDLDDGKDKQVSKRVSKFFKPVLTLFLVFASFATIIPSKSTMVTWIGLSATQTIHSEIKDSELYNKTMKVLNIKLDEILEKSKRKSNVRLH